jgi:hypothetical protein
LIVLRRASLHGVARWRQCRYTAQQQ